MTKETSAVIRRASNLVAEEYGIAMPIKGAPATGADARRMKEWLKKRGEPNLSPWRRRRSRPSR